MSYQLIYVDNDTILSWSLPYTGGLVVCDFNDLLVLEFTPSPVLKLPPANVAGVGASIIFNNVSLYYCTLQTCNGQNPTGSAGDYHINGKSETQDEGSVICIYLTDNTTPDGLWRIIPFGGGFAGINSLTAQNSDGSIAITDNNKKLNPTITQPGGTLNFSANPSIANLLNLLQTSPSGFLIAKIENNVVNYGTTTLIAGNNINISNSSGLENAPVINLNNTLNINRINLSNTIIIDGEIATPKLTINDFFVVNNVGDLDCPKVNTIEIYLSDLILTNNVISSKNNPVLINKTKFNIDGKVEIINALQVDKELTCPNVIADQVVINDLTLTSDTISSKNNPISLNSTIFSTNGKVKITNDLEVDKDLTCPNVIADQVVINDLTLTSDTISSKNNPISLNNTIFNSAGKITSSFLEIEKITFKESSSFINSRRIVNTDEGYLINNIEITKTSDLIIPGSGSLTCGQASIGNLSISSDEAKATLTDKNKIVVNNTEFAPNGDVVIHGTLKASKIQGVAACFVNFTDTGSGCASSINIINSLNIESVTGSKGNYKVTFKNAFENSNYVAVASLELPKGISMLTPYLVFLGNQTTSNLTLTCINLQGNELAPTGGVSLVIFQN